MEKIANLFLKKIAKILLCSSHSAAINNEFTTALGGGGWGYLQMRTKDTSWCAMTRY